MHTWTSISETRKDAANAALSGSERRTHVIKSTNVRGCAGRRPAEVVPSGRVSPRQDKERAERWSGEDHCSCSSSRFGRQALVHRRIWRGTTPCRNAPNRPVPIKPPDWTWKQRRLLAAGSFRVAAARRTMPSPTAAPASTQHRAETARTMGLRAAGVETQVQLRESVWP
jgi:hypothetical protein